MKFKWDDINDLFKVFDYTYADTKYFWFFLLLPIVIFSFYWRETKSPKNFRFSTLSFFKESTPLAHFRHLIPAFRVLALTFLIIALARPQDIQDETYQSKVTEGIDIVLAMDISTSMEALDMEKDMSINRLEAAQEIAKEFISNRPNDRIGLVVFDGEAITQCPLTTDHKYLSAAIEEIYPGMISDGTAIGDGLNTAVNRLRESKSKSKVVILLTDGKNTHGTMNPISAADVAAAYNVRVYTIAVGRDNKAPYKITDMFGRQRIVEYPSEVDTKTLQGISDRTNAVSYRAKDGEALREVYKKIDALEKSKVKITKFRIEPPEKFHWFALAALFFILLEFTLKNTVLKSLSFER
jgi:Ca-activated chloride channel family protein